MPLTKQQIAQRIAQEIQEGFTVNLGIGIPTLVANYIDASKQVFLQSENGLLGIGPFPQEEEVDPDLINAGKQTVTAVTGASFFDSSLSFAMIRGGHIQLAVLGAMQVDEAGSIANWMIPKKMVKGMGGAMDLVAGSRRVIVAMQHNDKKGNAKILKKCTLPLTGVNCIHHIVTDKAFIDVTPKGLLLKEIVADLSVEDIVQATEADLIIDENLKKMNV